MKFTQSVLALIALASSGVSGFATIPSTNHADTTALNMINEEGMKKAATSFVAAAFLMTSVAAVEPAFAMDEADFGSSQVIAARSGGRAGGRSSAARAPARAPVRSSAPSSRSTTVINRTVVSPPVVVGSPMYGGYGYGYNPVPGLGLSLGLNAINQIGNDMRDYRQETEIRDTRAALMNSQQREAEMEARLRQLEAMQGMTPAQQQQMMMMMQQQMQMNQQQAAAAAVPK